MKIKKLLFMGLFLIYLGTSVLVAQETMSILASLCTVLIGHILFLRAGVLCQKTKEFLLVDVCLAAVLTGYYFVFKDYKIGVVHHMLIGLIVWCAFALIDLKVYKVTASK